ncbi:hypothetical protein Baya_6191 [Bagarius yarrelli]|uniref:Uncharacterized protein n=1 Tax=Bagarius yarrelli TaxID=175774 RepID=A0A556TZW5_BAGYA|nr:hypothetical protein Baya_6191 [Bagarius yarrelli]
MGDVRRSVTARAQTVLQAPPQFTLKTSALVAIATGPDPDSGICPGPDFDPESDPTPTLTPGSVQDLPHDSVQDLTPPLDFFQDVTRWLGSPSQPKTTQGLHMTHIPDVVIIVWVTRVRPEEITPKPFQHVKYAQYGFRAENDSHKNMALSFFNLILTIVIAKPKLTCHSPDKSGRISPEREFNSHLTLRSRDVTYAGNAGVDVFDKKQGRLEHSLQLKLPGGKIHLSFAKYTDYALLLSGSSFYWGFNRRETLQTHRICHARALRIMSGTPESAYLVTAKPEAVHLISAKPELVLLVSAKPEPAYFMSAKPEPAFLYLPSQNLLVSYLLSQNLLI